MITALSRYAARRAHVFVVEVPGSWLERIRLEAALTQRGWPLAVSPADADVLAVCGWPDGELQHVVHQIWEQMPGPRVRLDITADQRDLLTALDVAAAQLRDVEHHRHDAGNRSAEPQVGGDAQDEEEPDHGDMDHGDMDHGDMDHGDHGDMDHGDMDHGDHGDMDHG
ncbi:MAG: hypothetical protein WA962_09300, partial [Ornithinimicrobium sp.]